MMANTPTDVAYLALDIETTGLDPQKDQILEVAWKALDPSLSVMEGFDFSAVVGLTTAGWDRLSSAPEVVRNMHSTSGLLGDVLAAKKDLAHVGYHLGQTLFRLHKDFDRVHLLGMSIHFDAEFLKANGFGSCFDDSSGIHHRMYDLSSVKLALAQSGIEYPQAAKGNHRAAADVDEAIEQARMFHGFFSATLATEAAP